MTRIFAVQGSTLHQNSRFLGYFFELLELLRYFVAISSEVFDEKVDLIISGIGVQLVHRLGDAYAEDIRRILDMVFKSDLVLYSLSFVFVSTACDGSAS